jgi:hypothetical protein
VSQIALDPLPQTLPIPLTQEARMLGDKLQGLLEVVGERIGKVLQLFVGTLQGGRLAVQARSVCSSAERSWTMPSWRVPFPCGPATGQAWMRRRRR